MKKVIIELLVNEDTFRPCGLRFAIEQIMLEPAGERVLSYKEVQLEG